MKPINEIQSRNPMKGIPYYTVYRLIKEHLNVSVSKDYINYVKKLLDDYVREIAISSLNELEATNELRRLHSLKPLRRISIEHFNAKRYINLNESLRMEIEDITNRDTRSSQAGER